MFPRTPSPKMTAVAYWFFLSTNNYSCFYFRAKNMYHALSNFIVLLFQIIIFYIYKTNKKKKNTKVRIYGFELINFGQKVY